jgi:hypothetical protein
VPRHRDRADCEGLPGSSGRRVPRVRLRALSRPIGVQNGSAAAIKSIGTPG